jgi:periplasmic protein TonB
MSDKYIEKALLYLVVLSVLLHLVVYELVGLIPMEKPKPFQETTTVDITDLPKLPPEPTPKPKPEPKAKPAPKPRPEAAPKVMAEHRPTPINPNLTLPERKSDVARFSDKRRRVAREIAPKGDSQKEKVAPPALKEGAAATRATQARRETPQLPGPANKKPQPTSGVPLERGGTEAVRRGEGIFRSRSGEGGGTPRLFPSAGKLARLEESYRKKYGPEVADGDAMFLNTDDIRFGSFLRRLETAVYGVWRYPHEALMRGIEGTTPVRITFNRKGEVMQVELLESSGSVILDDEVMRTLKEIGPIGSFPRGYGRESFKLIAFFHYGNGSERLH